MADNQKKSSQKWFEVKERATRAGIGYKLMLFTLKCFPAGFMRFLAFIIGFFYWLFSSRARKNSKKFLCKVNSLTSQNSSKTSTLKHFCSFALNIVENIQSWAGKFSFKNVTWQDDDVLDLVQNINEGKGAVCVISHLGNAQMMKALASMNQAGTERKMSITTVSDVDLNSGFVKLINKVNPDSSFHIVSSRNFGPDTILLLQERISNGEIVVIAGDRISATTNRYIEVPVFGQTAKLPYGVFLMIALLNAPTYFMFGLRHNDISLNPAYDMYVSKNPVSFECGRKEREEKIRISAENYVSQLERHGKNHPYQWYNFFDFWA